MLGTAAKVRKRRRSMRAWRAVVVTCLSVGLLAVAAVRAPAAGAAGRSAGAEARSGLAYVPDLIGQFNAIPPRPDAMGWHVAGDPQPTLCKHWQGLARSQGTGTPYLFVTRSGNATLSCPTRGDDAHGDLSIIRLDSRDTTGERLRSNRLRRDTDIVETAPPAEDRRVGVVRFDGSPVIGDDDGDRWPRYFHPGGVQLVGDVLAVPLEAPFGGQQPANLILFLDVSNPGQPTIISSFDPGLAGDRFSAGLVAVAPMPGGGHLMLVAGKDNGLLRVYTADPTPMGLRDKSLTWRHFDDISESTLEAYLGIDWPTGGPPFGDAHQMLNFVRDAGPDGTLYLLGARNTNSGAPLAEDHIDLYRVDVTATTFRLERVANRQLDTHATLTDGNAGSGNIANLAAASGAYVSPSGELIFYATEHDNTGPGGGTVNAGEWRHVNMVRDDSPTLDPTASAGGPYVTNEGSSVQLSGSGAPPVTAAWVELFADPDFGSRYVVIDHPDRLRDSYDDFDQLDGETSDHDNFSDDPSSVRWFAPRGCTIRLNDDHYGDGNFPGDDVLTLPSEGEQGVVSNPGRAPLVLPDRGPRKLRDLEDISNDARDNDMEAAITSVTFMPNCDAYYSAAMSMRWDLDGDGVFDVIGPNPIYSAAAVDGPATVEVGVQAVHPTDGRTGSARGTVQVANVAPTIVSAGAFDPTGAQIGADVPVAVARLPVKLEASFTDPGIADTQTASIDWGDGRVEGSAAFDSFSDASGGALGRAVHHHTFIAPGTYNVVLRVVDDDGGTTATTVTVEVLSVEGALQLVVDRLEELLRTETDPTVRAFLLDALHDLIGHPAGVGEDGALDQLARSNLVAVAIRIADAVDALAAAEGAGAGDLGTLKDLLGLAAYAVAEETHVRARAATAPPSEATRRRLDEIAVRIATGAASLRADDHPAALDAFIDAIRGAAPLCRCT